MGKRGTMRGKIYILGEGGYDGRRQLSWQGCFSHQSMVWAEVFNPESQNNFVNFNLQSIKVLCLFYLLAQISASALKLTALRSLAEVLPIKTRHIHGWFLRETKSPIPGKNGFRLILPNTVVFFDVRDHDISIWSRSHFV